MSTRACSPPERLASGRSSWPESKRKRFAHPATWMGRSRKMTVSPCAPSPARSVWPRSSCSPRLVEVDHAERVGALDVAGIGLELARQQAQQGRLARAVEAQQTQPRAGREREAEVAETACARRVSLDIASTETSRLVRRSVAVKSICGDAFGAARFQVGEFAHQAAGLIDARLRFSGARLGTAAQPFHFTPHLVGQRLLPARSAPAGTRSSLSRKSAVAAVDAEDAVGIDAVDLRHLVDHVVEKIAVVAHHHAGEGGAGEQLFEPQDAFQVEMIGGLVEEQQVGLRAPVRARWRGGAASRRRALRCARAPSVNPARPKRLTDARGAFHLVQVLARNGFAHYLRRDFVRERIRPAAVRIPRGYCGESRWSRNRAPAWPERIFSRVDLPEPLGPISPSRSPSEMPREIPVKSRREPKDLEMEAQLSRRAIGRILIAETRSTREKARMEINAEIVVLRAFRRASARSVVKRKIYS